MLKGKGHKLASKLFTFNRESLLSALNGIKGKRKIAVNTKLPRRNFHEMFKVVRKKGI